MASPDSDTRAAAIEFFADWLSRRESGELLEFDELLRSHPHLAADLTELEATWRSFAEASAPSPSTLSLHDRIKSRFGEDSLRDVSLRDREKSEARGNSSSALIAQLSAHSTGFGRYRIRGEVARGGMGAILKIWDEDLRRHLAMKVILGQTEVRASGTTPPAEASKVARFLEEAQVTGQLDHPGVVPVHELGLDPEGRLYFTMKLVKGISLKDVFDLVAEGKGGWTQTKALGVLLKVCEAMAYAHDKGVIHRDLKPANIMVGKFGEVHVMDWGLARILDQPDQKDIRIREEIPQSTELRSARDERRGETPESPLYTMDGDVVGTPSYMPPEQASGRASEVGPHSDVYALGAMLYHLLAGHMPYVPSGARLNNYAILGLVQQGPPTPIAQLSPETPAELVAICDKAMARDWKQRYRDMSELAADLSAYLEHRVVGAYETGTWAETKKWVERNKALAASLAAGLLTLVAGLAASLVFKARADERASDLQVANTTIQEKNADLSTATKLAQGQERAAREQEALAKREKANVLRLSAFQSLEDLEKEADQLWPATPDLAARYRDWLGRADALISEFPKHWLSIFEIEHRAIPQTSDEIEAERRSHPRFAEFESLKTKLAALVRAHDSGDGGEEPIAELRHEVDSLEAEISKRRDWRFVSNEDRWWHAQLQKLIAALSAFSDEKTGLMRGTSPEHGWGVAKRLGFAETIENLTVSGAEARRRWDEAVSAIATSPKYGGLKLLPQIGFLPIGSDPESGLWEFAHLATGEPAERGADGKLFLKESMGLVLVLIPGGTFRMGAQSADPTASNYDPQARSDESPVHEVRLSPYFLSKYEMTQGQWERFTGRNPSLYGPRLYHKSCNRSGKEWSALHPVEQVSWTQCMEVMTHLGLTLPSEAQWENAARGCQDTPYWTGSDLESLKDAANLSDAYGKSHGNEGFISWEMDLDDGNTLHADVGTYRANPFGLHDVIGNVWEWCLDGYDGSFYGSGPKLDPVGSWSNASIRVVRGGGWGHVASDARSAVRDDQSSENRRPDIGLRPASAFQISGSPVHPAGK